MIIIYHTQISSSLFPMLDGRLERKMRAYKKEREKKRNREREREMRGS
jgi:hypothetical protein